MRKFLLVTTLFAFLLACGGASTPEAAVKAMFDAMKDGNGQKVVSLLTADAVADIEENLSEPEDMAMELSFMGIEKTAEELEGITADEYMNLILSSEMMKMMWEMAEIEVGAATIDGDYATVEISLKIEFMGESTEETDEVNLVLEDGSWKFTEFGGGF